MTAAGLIEPDQRIEIKSKASGEVLKVHVREGDFVRAGDILVELKPDDEQRSADRAEFAVKRLREALATARLQVDNATSNIIVAEATIRELKAQVEMAKVDHKVEEAAYDRGQSNTRTLTSYRTRLEQVEAQLTAAEARLLNARTAVPEAEANVRIQEANLADAEKALEDAKDRLSETIIRAPTDAIVTQVTVAVGFLVQSGVGAFTGGTPLMTLADISRLKVVTRVDEADYGSIVDISPIDTLPQIAELRAAAAANAESLERRTGRVQIIVDAFRDQQFEGAIERVEPQGRLNAGVAIIQFNVHVDVTDPRRYLLPLGTQAQVEFTVKSAHDVLRVPAEAVKSFQDHKGVWVKVPPRSGSTQPGRRFVPCRFGITDGEYTEVVSFSGDFELAPGQEVYIKLPANQDGEEA